MTATQFIVPMDVQAFCVGRSDTLGDATDPYGTKDFARVGPDFSVLPHRQAGANVNPGPNVSYKALPPPFKATNDPLTEGVHLHWALPDGLVRGQGDAAGTGQVAFPQAPNRWLVVRLLFDIGGSGSATSGTSASTAVLSAVRGWVVESDRLSVDPVDNTGDRRAPSRTALIPRPADEDSNRAYVYLGQVFDAETWAENTGGTFAARTDALGFGDTAFAATYELCTNVFTFHDLLDDLPATYDPSQTTITYLVAGWYSDAAADPVTQLLVHTPGLSADGFVTDIRSDYAWTVSPAPADVPASTICSGIIEGIAWDPVRRYVATPAYDNGLVAAIGNNRVEAISALLASRPSLSNLPNVERLLQSLQAGLLPDFITDLVSVEERLHEHEFARRSGGTLWQVQSLRSTSAAAGPPATVTPVLPAGLAAALNELNIAQGILDRIGDEIVSRRQQIFADWTKYTNLLYGLGPQDLDADADVQPLILAEVAELDAAVDQRETAMIIAVVGAQVLVEALLTPDLELVASEAPRYWVPTDPVVLVAGDAATPAVRHGGDGRFDAKGMLVCRTTVVASAGQAGPTAPSQASESGTVALQQPPALTAPLPGAPIDALHALLAEVGCQAPAGIALSGTPGSPVGLQSWGTANPWIPLLLQWQVGFVPDHPTGLLGEYPPTLLTDNYRLDADAIDLDPVTVATSGPNLDIYVGTVGLGGRTSLAIETQIQAYLDNYPDDASDPELTEILSGLVGSNTPMMAQALGGLRSAMRMRRQVLQIPVCDPLLTVSGDGLRSVQFSNVTVPAAVGDQNTTAAEPDGGYHPIIAGQLNVMALRLVDTFGQVLDVRLDGGALIRSSSLRPQQDPPGETPVLLRPRLAQPARLNFRWLAADDDLVEANSDPASSPICGWALFNHLDSSLMIYDAGGTAIGSFSTEGPLWQGAPGATDMFAQITPAFADPAINPHLRNLALAIDAKHDAVGFLTDLLRAVDTTSTLIIPKGSAQTRSTSVLFGTPLAIVRAQVDAELHGLASIDESWDALSSTVKTRDGTTYPSTRPDAAFADVRIPVRLGDISNLDDGLVGYFIDDGSPAVFDTFYAAAADSTGRGVVAPAADTIVVTPRSGSTPVVLTMLVDPRCSVHATTGMLPTKDIEIPPAMYGDALQHMAVPFLVAPLMTGTGNVTIPVPSEPGWRWSWITRTSEPAGWSQIDAIASPNPRAAFDAPTQTLVEGWLRLTPAPSTIGTSTAGTGTASASASVSASASNGVTAHAPEEMIDMSALASGPAVRFSLTNAEQEPTLTIGDGLAINALTFTVTNRTAGPLTLFPGTPVPDGQSDADGPTTFYLYLGNVLTAAKLVITAPGWASKWFAASGYWALTPTAAGSLPAGAAVTFTVVNVDVPGPAQHGHVTVDYSRVGDVPDGFTHLPIVVEPAGAAGDPTLQLEIDFGTGLTTVVTTVDAHQPHINNLTLQLSTDVPNVAPTWDPATPPLFHLRFEYGDETSDGALTTSDLAYQIVPSPAPDTATSWGVDPQPTDGPVWTLRPKTGPILGHGVVAVFAIDGIVTFFRPGPTQVFVGWENVPGFAPGVATNVIQKIAPLALSPLTFDPAWIPTGQTVAPTLHWTATGVPTTLLLTAPHDAPVDTPVATSMLSPTAVTTSTVFTMRALRAIDMAVTDSSSTFPVVEFTIQSSGRIDAPDLLVASAMRRSPDAGLIYVGASDSFGKNLTSTVLVYDTTSHAQVGRFDDVVPKPPGENDFDDQVSMWIVPNLQAGVDRLAIAVNHRLVAWDIAADHTATKRASISQADNWTILGFRPNGTIAAIAASDDMVSQFTVLELDPLGVQPPHQLGPTFGGNGLFNTFMLTADGDHIVYLGWIGATPGPNSGDAGAMVTAPIVVRKSRLSDGTTIDETSVGTWAYIVFMMAVNLSVFTELPDGSVVLFTGYLPDPDTSDTPNPSPGGAGGPGDTGSTDDPDNLDAVPGILWLPLDGSGTSTRSAPHGGNLKLAPTSMMANPAQYSPNGTDMFIASDTGIWVAPSDYPDLGVKLPTGKPLGPAMFSPDGNVVTALIQSTENFNSFEIVALTRSVLPAPVTLRRE